MRNYKKEDFTKGQTVFIYMVGNAARCCKPGIESRIQEWEVKTVGSKYITAVEKNVHFVKRSLALKTTSGRCMREERLTIFFFLQKKKFIGCISVPR